MFQYINVLYIHHKWIFVEFLFFPGGGFSTTGVEQLCMEAVELPLNKSGCSVDGGPNPMEWMGFLTASHKQIQ